MQQEKRPLDPTRRLLRTFGVQVTAYEERTAAILGRASATPPERAEELLRLAVEVIELTADLHTRLREMNGHILDAEARVLSELKAALQRAQA